MEAAGLIEKVELIRPLRFNFEDIRKLPPPIIAFDNVAFSYSGKKEDYLYKNLSFGIEFVVFLPSCSITDVSAIQHGLTNCNPRRQRNRKVDTAPLIVGVYQPCEGTISKHTSLKLAKYSQHSADQLPYDKTPIEYFQSLYGISHADKDVMVRES